MIHRRVTAIICLLAFAPGLALAQTPDPAAERARLANERIQAEAERRAREEAEQQNRTPERAGQPAAAPNPPTQPQEAHPPTEPRRPSTDADRTERGLEQLRELGKLKDAGYLTDAEFQRIKQRILDSHFQARTGRPAAVACRRGRATGRLQGGMTALSPSARIDLRLQG